MPAPVLPVNKDLPGLGKNLVLLLKDSKFIFEARQAPSACTGREVIVRIRTTGICGSDVSWLQMLGTSPPQVLTKEGPLLETWKNRKLRG